MTHRILITMLAALGLLAAGCDTTFVEDHRHDAQTRVETFNFLFTMDDAAYDGSVASVQYDVPAITRGVLDHGAVLLYFREQGTWTATPYTFGVESPDLPAVDYTVSLGFGFDRRMLEVFYEASTDAVDLGAQPDREMKAVIIEDFGAHKTGLDVTDYQAVAAFYGLDD